MSSVLPSWKGSLMIEEINKLWLALYWVSMKLDRVCPMCRRKQPSGADVAEALENHLKVKHPEIL